MVAVCNCRERRWEGPGLVQGKGYRVRGTRYGQSGIAAGEIDSLHRGATEPDREFEGSATLTAYLVPYTLYPVPTCAAPSSTPSRSRTIRNVVEASLTELLNGNPALALPALFVGGVLTSLTPCVYPMIPITAAIVGGQTAGQPTSRLRPVLLTLTYVVGLALVYSALGVFAGITGTLFGSVSTNPWLYFAMANVLILAALSMLDVVPIRLPAGIMTRAATMGTAGRFSGAFLMGAMSGLVAAPCSAPVMAAVLTWVTVTHSATLGFVYLLTFSLGMGT